MKSLTFLLIVAVGALRAADYREATTRTVFPEVCDAWTRARVEEDARKEIGVSVAYSIKGGSTVTCRIFDGQFGTPSEDPEALRKELDAIATGVAAVWEKMGGTVELSLPVGPLPQDQKQFVVGHRIIIGGQQNISITLIRFYRGRYLSFRFTTPGSDGTAAFHELGRFLGALGAANKKEPNQAPEPTPGSVTPRAHARVAPAPVVAHL